MYNPKSSLALGKARQRELHEEARRARLIREANPTSNKFVDRAVASVGDFLISAGRRLRVWNTPMGEQRRTRRAYGE